MDEVENGCGLLADRTLKYAESQDWIDWGDSVHVDINSWQQKLLL